MKLEQFYLFGDADYLNIKAAEPISPKDRKISKYFGI
jgi:hypothetical protein